MGKKNLHPDSLINELKGGSSFFPTRSAAEPEESSPTSPNHQTHTKDIVRSRYHDTVVDTTIPSNHDTTIPTTEEQMLEAVRKAVKQVGKEPATQRLTLEEKKALKAIEFTYGQQGIITSGNEIIRIGMNYALQDYQKHGENSILAKVLKCLNS